MNPANIIAVVSNISSAIIIRASVAGLTTFCRLLLSSCPQLSPAYTMSKRVRIYTSEDVAAHSSSKSCWVIRNGKVYDVTSFLADHPGGDDLILNYAGKDVGEVMKDKNEHEHSESAYDMLEVYVMGRLGTDETIVSEGALFLLRYYRRL